MIVSQVQVKDALEKSIAHWQELANAKYPSQARLGPEKCGLCQLFYYQTFSCSGCPIKTKTEKRFCRGTPYATAVHVRDKWMAIRNVHEKELWKAAFQESARAMVLFLESLREEAKP